MADPDEIAVDVAGQLGGPSLDEQARVDAEQISLIDQIKADRAPAEAEERRRMDERLQQAIDTQSEKRSLIERVKQLEARVTALENK